jgi:trimethylamine:corrinoid methyltransferase-like protein
LRFAPRLIEECVAQSRRLGRAREMQAAPAPWQLSILSAYPTHLADPAAGGIRSMNEADVIAMTRLVDALHDQGVRGSTAGVPQDVPPQVRDIRCFRIGAENCREGGYAPISSLQSAEWLYRLQDLMGQPRALDVFVVSPLRAEGPTFDVLWRYRRQLQSVLVAGMPMMGVTAPVQVLGAFTLAVAAIWGAYAMARELTGLPYFNVECRIWPVSMRTAEIVYGTPEMVLSDLIFGQLRRFYGWPGTDCDAFHSSANLPDPQAAAQRGAYGMAMALAGRRDFRFGGLLGVDMVFSPAQLLLDLELLRYYRHVVDGFDTSEVAYCQEAIQEVGASGSYLDHQTTLEHHREVLWRSERWTYESLQRWLASDRRTFNSLAQQEIERLVQSHSFRLPGDTARELDRLCRQAEASLMA